MSVTSGQTHGTAWTETTAATAGAPSQAGALGANAESYLKRAAIMRDER